MQFLLHYCSLSDLVKMAGLDQSMIPFASFRNQLEQSLNQTRTTVIDQSIMLKNNRERREGERGRREEKHLVSTTRPSGPEIQIAPPHDDSRIVLGR